MMDVITTNSVMGFNSGSVKYLKNIKKESILNDIAIKDKCAAPQKHITYLSKKREEKDYYGRNKINASCIRLSS